VRHSLTELRALGAGSLRLHAPPDVLLFGASALCARPRARSGTRCISRRRMYPSSSVLSMATMAVHRYSNAFACLGMFPTSHTSVT
jgi:hypothetical protein